MKNILPNDGELYLLKAFYSVDAADKLLKQLSDKLDWQEEQLFIFGRWLKVPRLMCWYGGDGVEYKYSGVSHTPLPWLSELQAIRKNIEPHCGVSFNSVLANLYRNGQDSMGCHADDEKELGRNPVIASLSLGATRIFRLDHKYSKQRLDLDLAHGDLLIMAGAMQHHWKHSIPKTKKPKDARINLTFRHIWV